MQYYLAPMQSLTGYVFRNAYNKHFHNIDKYFTPFLSSKGLSNKDKNEVMPEHNQNMTVVPQIMTNQADVFLEIAEQMKDYGYTSVNLNLGCPSGTVVPKKRGAGLLSDLDMLERLLDEIFAKCPLQISIKTRIGMESPTEWENIQKIYKQYPMEELIIHPRLQADQYKNHPNLDIFKKALEQIPCPVCYNGDIHSLAQYRSFTEQFPQVTAVMLGRGILKNPGLIGEITESSPVTADILLAFHEDILAGYKEEISGDINILYKMKELWSYFGDSFKNSDNFAKRMKKLMKTKSLTEFHSSATQFLTEYDYSTR